MNLLNRITMSYSTQKHEKTTKFIFNLKFMIMKQTVKFSMIVIMCLLGISTTNAALMTSTIEDNTIMKSMDSGVIMIIQSRQKTSANVLFEAATHETVQISVTDENGNEVFSGIFSTNETVVITNLTASMTYDVRMTTSEGFNTGTIEPAS